MTQIRNIAICVIQKGNSLFLMECHDSVKKETYYRPLGGGVEFGEIGEAAVRREFKEEIGADLMNLSFVGTLENLFTLEGKPGHEIVLIYKGDFSDPNFYEIKECPIIEDGKQVDKGIWKPLKEFQNGNSTLYPDGLLGLMGLKTRL